MNPPTPFIFIPIPREWPVCTLQAAELFLLCCANIYRCHAPIIRFQGQSHRYGPGDDGHCGYSETYQYFAVTETNDVERWWETIHGIAHCANGGKGCHDANWHEALIHTAVLLDQFVVGPIPVTDLQLAAKHRQWLDAQPPLTTVCHSS